MLNPPIPLQTILRSTHAPVARCKARRPLQILPHRKYATPRDHVPPSLLTNVLDQKVRQTNRAASVGPFQWGVAQPAIDYDEKVKKWNELSTSGKVVRTTARTTSLTIVLLGAGLSALLIYSLTSELFSKNSPTVLYNQACERIKASRRVARYLREPLAFHNNPPSVVRPRHRNRPVSYYIAADKQGREHMFLHFYVHGSDPASSSALHGADRKHFFDGILEWIRNKAPSISDLNLGDSIAWTRAYALRLWERSKNTFRYLSGTPIAPIRPPLEIREMESKEKTERNWWGATGLFGALRKNRDKVSEKRDGTGSLYTEGEVHAELVQNDEGYFVFRYLVLDLPSSRHPQERVWIQKASGVTESEMARLRWES